MSLKSLRNEKGYTQEAVASHLNITRAAYTNIENGKRQLDSYTIVQLADLYQVPADLILGRTFESADTENQPTAKGDELDDELVNLLVDLSPSEVQRVLDFVAGLKASRKDGASPQ